MALESVGALAMHVILSKLAPADASSVACVSRRFQSWVSDDESLWSKFCLEDLELKSPLGPLGNAAPSYKVSRLHLVFYLFTSCVSIYMNMSASVMHMLVYLCDYKTLWNTLDVE